MDINNEFIGLAIWDFIQDKNNMILKKKESIF